MTSISQLSGRLATSLTPQDASSSAMRAATFASFCQLTRDMLSCATIVLTTCSSRVLRSARHTVSGVIGKVMSRTPRCHSASITALPIAAGAPIVPLSLPPLTPSGLLGAGVAMKAVWNDGRSRGARHGVIHEACRQELAGLAVVDDLLHQRLADALRQAAVHLPLDDHRIDHDAAIVGARKVRAASRRRSRDRR